MASNLQKKVGAGPQQQLESTVPEILPKKKNKKKKKKTKEEAGLWLHMTAGIINDRTEMVAQVKRHFCGQSGPVGSWNSLGGRKDIEHASAGKDEDRQANTKSLRSPQATHGIASLANFRDKRKVRGAIETNNTREERRKLLTGPQVRKGKA